MIDKVQKALEIMAPELASYKTRKIFTEAQINRIIENRRRFENKLQRSAKRISDFIGYAHSELKLEKIRNKKIAETGAGLEETDLILENNIFKIYENAIYHFNEPFLIKEYSEYCIKKKAVERMKTTFASKCLKNLRDTDLWIYCAQQLCEVEDSDGARSLFMKAISVNQDYRLYIEFFRFECIFAQKLNAINQELGVEEDEKDEIEKGQIALIVLQSIIDKFGVKYESECVEIAKNTVPELETKVKSAFSIDSKLC